MKKNITGALASATCALLGGVSSTHAGDGSWQIDTAVMAYKETDRVQAVEPVISATKSFSDDRKLNIKIVVDSLTGASPSGATPTDQVQTLTRPSGNGSYTTAAGDTPLDDTFKDSRVAFGVQWEQPINAVTKISTGANYSKEYDYQSIAVNASVSREFNKKNTTLTGGFAYSSDTISPEGEIPIPFSSMTPAGTTPPRQDTEDDKTVTDILFGVTQIINAQSLMQFNYSYSKSDGYLTDPFKILSVVDGVTGSSLDYVFEHRPDTRAKHSLFWQGKYRQDSGNIINLSYRYMTDDWDINSHTIDFRYRWAFFEGQYLEPHIRYYTQDEAEFYTHSITSGAVLPEFASNDPRLGAFDGITFGVKYGVELTTGAELSFRLEYYQQTGDNVGDLVGIQRNYDQFPDLDAVIAQISYSFKY